MVELLKPEERETNSLSSHSRKETPPFSSFRIFSFKRKERKPSRRSNNKKLQALLNPRLRVARAKRRLPQNQLLRERKLLNLLNLQLQSERVLIKL